MRLVLTSETRDFPGIVWDYATRTETRTTVRNPAETGPGRPWMTTVNKGETISRQTIPARLRSPVLLVDLTAGELRKRMEGAPFGFPRQEPSSGVPGLLLDGTSPSEVKRYQLPAETDLLLDAWSWGIP